MQQLTEEQKKLLAEIQRLDMLTVADVIEDHYPEKAQELRERAATTGIT